MRKQLSVLHSIVPILAGLIVLFGLYLTSLYSYLLFHTLAEMFAIVIACRVFVIALNSRRFIDNAYLVFIGIAFLFVGIVDLIHTMAYDGMKIFRGFGANLSTQLWIAARSTESLSFLLAPLFLRRKANPYLIIAGYAIVVSVLLASVFLAIFPDCYIEGQGLTPFKRASEYVICSVLLVCVAMLLRDRKEFDQRVFTWLMACFLLTIGAEIAFTLYISVYGISNLIGHFFKLIAFYMIYRAIIETGLVRPYDLLFRNLAQREEELTSVNHELSETNAGMSALNADMEKRAQQLERSEKTLLSRNEELKGFAYTVSHDLKAPLRGIAGYAQELDRRHRANLSERAEFCLTQILTATRNLDSLIEDLLHYSRLDAETPSVTDVNLASLVEAILQDRELVIAEQRVEVTVDIPFTTLRTWKRGLVQVLTNLIDNALKYSRNASPPRLGIRAEDLGNAWRLTVSDNGIGFDMKYLDRIFGLFNRLVRAEEFEGTGAGLSIVKKVLDKQGGRIWAESAPGLGATFFVELPRPDNQQ